MYSRLKVLFVFLLISHIYLFAQPSDTYIQLRGITEEGYNPAPGVSVKLHEGNKLIEEQITEANGEFQFKLDTGKYYLVSISKPGYVSKRIAYDTKLPFPEKMLWKNDCSFSLMKECEGVDLSVLEKPIDIIKYHPKSRSFKSDKDYTKKTFRLLDEIYYQLENCEIEKFDTYLEQGEKLYSQNKYEEAKDAFQNASDVFPDRIYPKDRIKEINEEIMQGNADMVRFESLKKSGNDLVSQNKIEEAISAYEEAYEIKKNDTDLNTRLNALKKQINDNKLAASQKENEFNNLLTIADNYYKNKNYPKAKENYQKALVINPDDVFTKTRLERVNSLIEKDLANNSKEQEKQKEEAYENLIIEANNLQSQNKLQEAMAKNKEALLIKPGDADAQQNIAQLNNLINQQKQLALANEQKRKQELLLAEQKRKQDLLVAEQKEKQFNLQVNKANALFAQGKLEQAKQEYNNALTIKPGDQVVQSQVRKIDIQLNKEKQTALLAQQKDIKYKQIINEGETLLAAGNFSDAKLKFTQALQVKPNDALSQQKITEINNVLAKQEQDAAAQEQKQKQYALLMNQANGLMTQGNLDMAKQKYEQALTLKPGDNIASDRINNINSIQGKQKQDALLAKQKDDQFNGLISQGDDLVKAGEYEQAKLIYEKALLIKSGDNIAQGKLKNTNLELAKAKQANLLAEQKDQKFNQYIQESEQLKSAGQLEEAKQKLSLALQLKPNDAVALQKNKEITSLQQKELLAKKENERKEQQYKNLLSTADQFLANNELGNAEQAYKQAQTVKPGDTYPLLKLKEVEEARVKEKQKQQLAREKEQNYNQSITKGNSLMAQGDFVGAKSAYQEALGFKSADAVAISKMREVDLKINQKQQAQLAEKQKLQQYNEYIKQADIAYSKKDYQSALSAYNNAKAINSTSAYPSQKINELNKLVAEQKQEAENKKEYDQILVAANSYYKKHDLQNAKLQYEKALVIDPGSSYAKLQIEKIDKVLSAANNQAPVKTVAKSKLVELKFKNDAERNEYLVKLSKKYPAGITLEVYKEEYKTTSRYIVVREGKANEYREIKHSWGGVDYFINDKATNDMYFRQQTRKRAGEYYKKVDM